MNGELLVIGAPGLVRHLLLASVDVVLFALKPKDFTPLAPRNGWLLLPAALLMLCGISLAGQPQEETANLTPGSAAEIQPPAAAEQAVTEESMPEPAETELAPDTADVLAKTIEANRYWFEGPPQRVSGYRYTFVHRDGQRQEFTVTNPRTAGAWVKRGITYTPLAHVLLKALGTRLRLPPGRRLPRADHL